MPEPPPSTPPNPAPPAGSRAAVPLDLVQYTIRSAPIGAVPLPKAVWAAFQSLVGLLNTTRERHGGALDLRRSRHDTAKPIHLLKRRFWGDAAYAPEMSARRGELVFDDVEHLLAHLRGGDEAGSVLQHATAVFSRLLGRETPTLIREGEAITIFYPPQHYTRRMIQAFARDRGVLLVDADRPIDRVPGDVWVDRYSVQIAINQCEQAIRMGAVSGTVLTKPLQTLRGALTAIGDPLRPIDPEAWGAYAEKSRVRILPYRCAHAAEGSVMHLFSDTIEEAEDLLSQILAGDDAALLFFSALNEPIEGTLEGIRFSVPAIRPVFDAVAVLRDRHTARHNEALYDRLMSRYAPAVLVYLDIHKMVDALRSRGQPDSAKRPWTRAFEDIEMKYHPLHAVLKNNLDKGRAIVAQALEQARDQAALLDSAAVG